MTHQQGEKKCCHKCENAVHSAGCWCECHTTKRPWAERFDEEFDFLLTKNGQLMTVPAVSVERLKAFIAEVEREAVKRERERLANEIESWYPRSIRPRIAAFEKVVRLLRAPTQHD